jgi:hypothetical protein
MPLVQTIGSLLGVALAVATYIHHIESNPSYNNSKADKAVAALRETHQRLCKRAIFEVSQ